MMHPIRITPLRQRAAALLLVLASASCATREVPVTDRLLESQPGSILVLPPLNNTVETEATYGSMSSVTVPLAEAGYYVFPVAVVDAMMRENGLPTPADMHSVPLAKLNEIFAPDAVLYLTVTDWGTSYEVISSTTRVSIEGRLVEPGTGAELWRGTSSLARSSNSGQGGLVGMLAGAVINQVATAASDPSPGLAREVNYGLLTGRNNGWILGPRHPDVAADIGEVQKLKVDAASR